MSFNLIIIIWKSQYLSTYLLTNMTTGQYISKLSEERRFSQSDVARQTGLSRQIISYIISGKRELTLQQALRLESLFNLKQGTLVRMQMTSASIGTSNLSVNRFVPNYWTTRHSGHIQMSRKKRSPTET